MNIIYPGCETLPLNTNEYSVCLGVFDGVHKGHRELILKCIKRAKELSIHSAAVAFLPETRKERIYLLEQQAEIFEKLGIDTLFVIPLNEEIRNLSCIEFMEKWLISYIHARHIVCGYDYTFGANKSGNADTIKEFSKNYGYSYDIIDAVCLDNEKISSTAIRKYLLAGNIEKANLMLGEYYHINGCVKKGFMLGRTIGFPTANIEICDEITPLKKGVYSSFVIIDGKKYKSITNIGVAPTMEREKRLNSETYIIDYSGDLYNRYITVNLTGFLREEKKFKNEEELKKAITENVRMLINK